MNAGSEAVRSNGPHRSSRKGWGVGRKRRVAGWSFATAGVVVAALWVASGWWKLVAQYEKGAAVIEWGTLWSDWHSDFDLDPRLAIQPTTDRRHIYWFGLVRRDRSHLHEVDRGIASVWWGPDSRGVTIALWPIALLLWTPAALLLRSGIRARRRAMTGSCAKCSYSLAGLGPDAPCPECGKTAKTTA